ncbi:MAG: hypothetical protein ACJ75H_07330 [Thermoanaerobaculia bacterium]
MKRALWVLVALGLGIASAQPSRGIAAVQYCPICIALDGSWACYFNNGTNCTPPAGVAHCTVAQASICPGWAGPGGITPE